MASEGAAKKVAVSALQHRWKSLVTLTLILQKFAEVLVTRACCATYSLRNIDRTCEKILERLRDALRSILGQDA
jgi:hypothetical protein